jgi:hypothetical protein
MGLYDRDYALDPYALERTRAKPARARTTSAVCAVRTATSEPTIARPPIRRIPTKGRFRRRALLALGLVVAVAWWSF